MPSTYKKFIVQKKFCEHLKFMSNKKSQNIINYLPSNLNPSIILFLYLGFWGFGVLGFCFSSLGFSSFVLEQVFQHGQSPTNISFGNKSITYGRVNEIDNNGV